MSQPNYAYQSNDVETYFEALVRELEAYSSDEAVWSSGDAI